MDLVVADRNYWANMLSDLFDVVGLITGFSAPNLIGWCGREYAWVDCGGEVLRIFKPGHPGAIA